MVVVVPGGRARRRLLELLVEAAQGAGPGGGGPESASACGGASGDASGAASGGASGGGGVVPPELITVGSLPERLYEWPASMADELVGLLGRLDVLRAAPTGELKPLLAHPPEEDDLAGWLAVAEELGRLEDDLAAEGLSLGRMPEHLAGVEGFAEAERWGVLARLHGQVLARLQRLGLADRNEARLGALEAGLCRSERPIVLVGVADMPRLHRRMLRNVEADVTALVHAPEEEADSFDEVGCLRVEPWCERAIDLAEQQVRVVDGPRDQVMQVLRLVIGDEAGEAVESPGDSTRAAPAAPAREPRGGLVERYGVDGLTVGLGDEALGPPLERALEMAGVPSRLAAGRLVSQSRPATLLAALADYLRHQRRDAFATLLRHPDIERYLDRTATPPAAEEGAGSTKAWQTLLDEYINEHLPLRIDGHWLGGRNGDADRLAAAREALMKLLPDELGKAGATGAARRLLHDWCGVIAGILEAIYPDALHRHGPEDERILARALGAIGDTLRSQHEARKWEELSPSMTLTEAITLTLHHAGTSPIPPPAGSAAVEMLGWLELALDDAPALVITGVNEGAVPASHNADLFLPDHVRAELGLVDNRRRLSRDAFALRTMLESRDSLTLISARRDADGDPLTPSRLLMMREPSSLAPWVRHFYGAEEAEPQPPVILLEAGKTCRIAVPAPVAPDPPLPRLSVTAFRDYMACPYRFYLRHVQRLEALDDSAVEMDGAMFGEVAHAVLARFADSPLPNAADVKQVTAFLSEQLDAECARRFGRHLPPPLWVQKQQLAYRLEAFADWHVAALEDGWEVMATERRLEAVLDVDGEPFAIRGQIDRIDRHREGHVRIIDYKTADTAVDPDRAHRAATIDGELAWVDLQLPLYTVLASELEVVQQAGQLEVGYVNLPKQVNEVAFHPAPWPSEEIEEAIETAIEVIRRIRGGVFWPPVQPPPRYSDDLAAICLDHCPATPGGVA